MEAASNLQSRSNTRQLRRRDPRRRFHRMPEPNSGDRCSRGCRLVRFLDRKIVARLPTLYPRRVEWTMIPDYRDFTIGSMFKGTDQSPARSALLTANWRGCEGRPKVIGHVKTEHPMLGSDPRLG